MTALQKDRSLSLDVFRGMTVCFMIIVNTPGSGAIPFAPLLHAQWNGFTPTDLVFPSFLFAVGNAMSFSMTKQCSNSEFLGRVFKRAFLIFLLGYLMYWFPFFTSDASGNFSLKPVSHTRIFGVLQRIALCYFIASLLIRFLTVRAVIISCIILLFGYWFSLLLFSSHGDPYGMVNNAGTVLDKYLLGEDHLYHGEGVPFDPEGILSTLPAVVNVVIGYFAGMHLRQKGRGYQTITELFMCGAALILLALVWNNYFPINKKLWSASFVLLTTGLDLCILGGLIYLIELRKYNPLNWTAFFTVFGKNPLFIYLLSELLLIILIEINMAGGQNLLEYFNTIVFQSILPGPFGSLAFALAFMLLCWIVGLWLDKKKIYIRV